MPTKFQVNSLVLCIRIFSTFLWKYVLYFDTRTSSIVFIADKWVVRKWAFFDTIFILGGLVFVLLIGLTKILIPTLLPRYRLIDAVLSVMIICCGSCLLLCESAIYIYGAECCSAYRDLVKQERTTVMSSKVENQCSLLSEKTRNY
jgi:uncharacterized membrane protein